MNTENIKDSLNLNEQHSFYREFVEIKPIYNLKRKLKQIKDHCGLLLYCNFKEDIDEIINLYLKAQKNKIRKFKGGEKIKKAYQNNFGVTLTIMLNPNYNDAFIKKSIPLFMKNILGNEKLLYLAYKVKLGQGTYLRIVLLDREKGRRREKVYDRNYYRNAITKKMCSKHDEHAELICRKGDVIRDKQGNVMYTEPFEESKTRLFHQPTEKLKALVIKSFYRVKKMVKRSSTRISLFFKREQFRPWWNKKLLAGIRARNQARINIETVVDIILQDEVMYHSKNRAEVESNPLIFKHIDENGFVFTPLGMKIKRLFYDFEEKFKEVMQYTSTWFRLKKNHTTVRQMRQQAELLEVEFLCQLNSLLPKEKIVATLPQF